MWSIADIADALETGLTRRAAALDEEHAVHGLDALEELELHPILADALSRGGLGVHREERYPADRTKRKESAGERCDFVLTSDNRPLQATGQATTLFDPPDAVELAEAYWLEAKVVAQFTIEGPNPRYSAQLLSGVRRDVTKLSKDRDIYHAGILIVLFAQDQRIAEHDLHVWYDRCVARGLPAGYPARRFIEITNRLGNGVCAVAVHPVSHL